MGPNSLSIHIWIWISIHTSTISRFLFLYFQCFNKLIAYATLQILNEIKVTQINYVSRNHLHSTANGCQHLNFGLMCKGKTLLGVVNKLFIFSSADLKQNLLLNWHKNSNFFALLRRSVNFRMTFWCLKFSKKTPQKFDEFLPYNLDIG